MLYPELNCTSVLSVISLDDRDISDTLSMLSVLAPRPPDAAGIGRVSRGSLAAVQAVISMIGQPSEKLLQIEIGLLALAQCIEQKLHDSRTHELAAPMLNRKVKFQQWSVLATLAEQDMPFGACLAAGVEILRAWKEKREITQAATVDIAAAQKDEPLSRAGLELLLNGRDQDENIPANWHTRLRRSWRHVVLHYGAAGSTPPPMNFDDQAKRQILDSSVYASPGLRAGAADHRQLSKLQMKDVLPQIGSWIEDDDFRGAYGVMVCSTGFKVDLISSIPLLSESTRADWAVVIDVATGCLKTDVSSLAQDAASVSTTATMASNFVCIQPMPKKLAADLRARHLKNPAARCLGELYPEATELNRRAPVVRCHDEIKPSWARLRHSTGTFIRQLGVDNLLACMISGDYGHVPRSKLYYACVEPEEMGTATARFYSAAGWGAPVEMPMDALAFGCRVVPSPAQIRGVNQWWVQAILSMAPAKHCGLAQVLEHHNRFMALTALRLAILFAMRETQEYSLYADVDERVDLWLPLDDKSVPGFGGALPVPLTTFAAKTVGAVRMHCRALHARLLHQSFQHSPLGRWCDKVVHRQKAPLLMKCASPHHLLSVGTQEWLRPMPAKLACAPDAGRKLMENALRHQGLRTGDIDAMLRHSVEGQSKASSASDFNLLDWLKRVTPVMDDLAIELFGTVCFGLSKE